MSEPLLRVRSVTKTFPGLVALDDVSLEVRPGEVVAVVGHNGSGKSTLVKVLAGVHAQDSGTVECGGRLHFIHQDLALVAELSTVENLHLLRGAGPGGLAPVPRAAQRVRARELVGRFGDVFDVDVPVRLLTPAQRAVVAIARALDGWQDGGGQSDAGHVVVLDEPTESLHRTEVEVLFAAVRRLAAQGAGVVFISHRLDEVLSLADRVAVLRDGRKMADAAIGELDHARLVELVTGTAAATAVRERGPGQGAGGAAPVLSVRGLRGGAVRSLDLDVRPGEVVGVAGVLGSGREAVAALLFGAVRSEPGGSQVERFTLCGEPYPRRSPSRSIRRGMGYVPGDRARYGSIGPMTARENLTLPQLRPLRGRLGAVSRRREAAEVGRLLERFDVRPPRPEQTFAHFSGGNQQKIVMARWLRGDPAVLLLDEPTQGVDIGVKQAVYAAIDAAAAAGTAVLVGSSDAAELVRLCDRVLVLRDGDVVAEVAGSALTARRLVVEGYGLDDSSAEPADRTPPGGPT